MPVNSWHYLMGDRQTHGHNASTYTLEDYSELVKEYDRYLAPYLSIANPIEPNEPREPFRQASGLDDLKRENAELKDQIMKLTKLLTDQRVPRAKIAARGLRPPRALALRDKPLGFSRTLFVRSLPVLLPSLSMARFDTQLKSQLCSPTTVASGQVQARMEIQRL